MPSLGTALVIHAARSGDGGRLRFAMFASATTYHEA
jgi:hypothetical protein